MERSSQYFLLVVFLLLVHCSLAIVANIPENNITTDLSSLIALKSHITSDPDNILMKNWTTKTSVCSWVGVTCDSRYNRVTELNISFMGLVGTIPREIENLSFLVSLDMSNNSFHGPIPPSIFNMSSLEVLALRMNNLSSVLPDDMCKHGLHKLKRIRISYNNLYGGIPSSLDQCSQLQYLSFFGNNFSGQVPREIGNMTLLEELYLGANNLSGGHGSARVRHTIRAIRLLCRDKHVRYSHLHREGNRAADFLVSRGTQSTVLTFFDTATAPRYLLPLVRMDQLGFPNFRFRYS